MCARLIVDIFYFGPWKTKAIVTNWERVLRDERSLFDDLGTWKTEEQPFRFLGFP